MRLRAFRVVQKSTADDENRYPRSIAETGVWQQNGEEHRDRQESMKHPGKTQRDSTSQANTKTSGGRLGLKR